MNRRRAMMRRASGGVAMPGSAGTTILTLPFTPDGLSFNDAGDLWIAGFNGAGLRRYNSALAWQQTIDATGDYRGVEYYNGFLYGAEYDDDSIRRWLETGSPAGGNIPYTNPRDITVYDDRLVISTGATVYFMHPLPSTSVWTVINRANTSFTGNIWGISAYGDYIALVDTIGHIVVYSAPSLLIGVIEPLHTVDTGMVLRGIAYDGSNWIVCADDGSLIRLDNA